MNLPNESVLWGLGVVTYETLATIAAGVAIVSLFMSYVKGNDHNQQLGKNWEIAWIVMSGILFAVPVILGLHLEQPLRSITIYFKGNPTSPMPYGVLTLSAWLITAVYGLLGIKKNNLTPERKKTLSLSGSVLGILFVTYLGFLLSVMKGVTLWNSALKPVQYVVATLGVGSAVVLLAYYLLGKSKEDTVLKHLTQWMLVGIAANILIKAIAALYAVYVAKTPGLTAAGLSISLYGLEWGIGLILPLVLLWLGKRSQASNMLIYLVTLSTIIGTFAEKFNLIVGGQLMSRTGNLLAQEARHIWGMEAWQAVGGLALAIFFLLALLIIIPIRNDKAGQTSIPYSSPKNLNQ